MTDDQIDVHLDNILKASGSALKHYSIQKTKDDMRQALRQAIAGLESQEPVAWVQDVEFEQLPEFAFSWVKTILHDKPLYTHPPQRTEQNFCPRCGKRTNDIHTCTPPQRTWVGLTNDELTDLFYNTNLGQQSAVAQAIALLEEKNT